MNEYELIYLSKEFTDLVLTILQLWISISFGLVAVAHFASHKLNALLLTILNILYISTTAFLAIILSRNLSIQASLFNELAILSETTDISNSGQLIANNMSPLATIFALIAEFGTFIGCVAYLNFSYLKSKQSNK